MNLLYFGLRLHKEANQWRIQGGQGPDPPPPPATSQWKI